MRLNRIRQAALEGRVAVGHMLMEFDTPGIAKLCSLAELDFVLIDMEHGPLEIPQVARLISRLNTHGRVQPPRMHETERRGNRSLAFRAMMQS